MPALTSPRLSRIAELKPVASGASLLRVGSRGAAVAALQRALFDLGNAMPRSVQGGVFDGIFGQETHAAVTGFQRERGLVTDGIVGPNTLSVLDQFFRSFDPWFADPVRTEAEMLTRMIGPPEQAPFGTFTLAKS